MKNNLAVTGNSGPRVRSDCEICFEATGSGGIKLDLQSKVRSMYGKSINDLVYDILSFYNIKNASVKITDSGALPFVISARLEAAIRITTGSDGEYLPEMNPENSYESERSRF
ncbi:MAG: citrate lyase acyl carrier protein, partial [Bacteroidales bacterium]|nr:citrate lyase acyl carrier protein [Bacteroidales bacterium]